MVPLGVTAAEGTIADDDTAPTGLTISSVSHNQVDEDAGATDITVTVALDGTTQFTVDTPVTVAMIDRPGVQNNATLGVDYTATTANAAIPAGESSVTATITLTPVDDTLSEDDEIARLSAKSTVFAGSAGKGVKIIDNDVEPGEVVLTAAPDTVSESVLRAVDRHRRAGRAVVPGRGHRREPGAGRRYRYTRERTTSPPPPP